MTHTTERRRARSAAYADVLCARGLATVGEATRWAAYLAALRRRHVRLDARDRDPRRATLSTRARDMKWAAR